MTDRPNRGSTEHGWSGFGALSETGIRNGVRVAHDHLERESCDRLDARRG